MSALSADLEVDPDDLIDVGELTLPYAADFYDEMASRLGALGQAAASGLFPATLSRSSAGNALAEAIMRCHRFLYAVTEETADSHRAVGRAVAEAGHDYRQADDRGSRDFAMAGEDLAGAVADEFTAVDAGEYEFGGEYRFGNFDRAEGGSGYEEALSGEPRQPEDHQDFAIDRPPVFERVRNDDRYGERPPIDERRGR